VYEFISSTRCRLPAGSQGQLCAEVTRLSKRRSDLCDVLGRFCSPSRRCGGGTLQKCPIATLSARKSLTAHAKSNNSRQTHTDARVHFLAAGDHLFQVLELPPGLLFAKALSCG